METSYWSKLLHQRIQRRRALVGSAGVAAAAAFLAACGGGSNNKGSTGTTGSAASSGSGTAGSSAASGASGASNGLIAKVQDTSAQVKKGGILKDYALAEPRSLDPSNPQADYNRIAPFVYSTLLVAKPGHLAPATGEIQGQLAESWEVAPDGLTITMKLRQGVKFHNIEPVNGRTFDTDDVMYSFKHYQDIGPLASLVFNSNSPSAPVLNYAAPDSKTIVMKLKDPIVYTPNWFAAFGSFTGCIIMYPKEADGGFDLRKEIIGTGPFQIKNHTPSVNFTLGRNPDYWDEKATWIDEIQMPIVPDYTSRESQLKAGNIYYSISANTLTAEDTLSLKSNAPKILLYAGPYSRGSDWVVSFGHLPAGQSKFQDERVRQAVSMSWDRDLFINARFNVDKFEKAGLPVDTKWNSHLAYGQDYDAGGWWLDPKGKDFGPNAQYYKYNLSEAKKLLSAANFPSDYEVEVRYPNASQFSIINDAQPIIGFLQALGMKVKDNGMTDYTQDYIPHNRDASGEYEGIGIHSITGNTPTLISAIAALASQYLPSSGVTFHGFDVTGKGDKSGDPMLTDMLNKASTNQDVATQKSLIKEAQRYLGKTMYAMYLPGTAQSFYVAWPAVKNFYLWDGGSDETWEHYQMWIDPTQAPLA